MWDVRSPCIFTLIRMGLCLISARTLFGGQCFPSGCDHNWGFSAQPVPAPIFPSCRVWSNAMQPLELMFPLLLKHKNLIFCSNREDAILCQHFILSPSSQLNGHGKNNMLLWSWVGQDLYPDRFTLWPDDLGQVISTCQASVFPCKKWAENNYTGML